MNEHRETERMHVQSGIEALLYLSLITISLFLIQSHFMISSSSDPQQKKHPNLPLRFNTDGTFKILQVS